MRPTLILSLLLGACAHRAGGPPTATPPPWAWEERRIIELTARSAEAWNRGDLRGHLALYADSVTFMTDSGPRSGVAPIEESFARKYFAQGRPRQTLRFGHLAVRPLGVSAALETGQWMLTGGGLPDQDGWFTLIWLREPEGWRVVHDHSS